MANSFMDGAMCPYYLRCSRLSVTCEGLGAFSAVKHEFSTEDERTAYCWKYCMAFDYKYCPHAYIMDIVLNDD